MFKTIAVRFLKFHVILTIIMSINKYKIIKNGWHTLDA